ncbi:MAG TPA: hypothetical protein VKP88_06635 [Candidatus Paceibacterota bacterium]|nr:hypothetical protein [Candidatus Paceibacterota bacterium]
MDENCQRYQAARERPIEALKALGLHERSSEQDVFETLKTFASPYGVVLTGVADARVLAVYACLRGQPLADTAHWVLREASLRNIA